MEIIDIRPALLSQLLLGLVNGSFYAILSLGLAVIFGLLNVINFAHGALFMMGAVLTWMAMNYFDVNYWVMLVAGAADRRACSASSSSDCCCAGSTSSTTSTACC